MKSWPVIICLLLITFQGYSQTPEVDSLIQVLKNYAKPDSARAQLLMDIAIKLRRVNPKESQKYYEESYQVALTANEPAIEVKANNGVGICYGMLGEYPMAIQTFHKTIELGKKYKDFLRIADGYN